MRARTPLQRKVSRAQCTPLSTPPSVWACRDQASLPGGQIAGWHAPCPRRPGLGAGFGVLWPTAEWSQLLLKCLCPLSLCCMMFLSALQDVLQSSCPGPPGLNKEVPVFQGAAGCITHPQENGSSQQDCTPSTIPEPDFLTSSEASNLYKRREGKQEQSSQASPPSLKFLPCLASQKYGSSTSWGVAPHHPEFDLYGHGPYGFWSPGEQLKLGMKIIRPIWDLTFFSIEQRSLPPRYYFEQVRFL